MLQGEILSTWISEKFQWKKAQLPTHRILDVYHKQNIFFSNLNKKYVEDAYYYSTT